MIDAPEKLERTFEDSTRRIWTTSDPERLIVEYLAQGEGREDRPADGPGRAEVNNRVSSRLFEQLQEHGVPTHFLGILGARETLVRAVRPLPLHVTVRNRAAGEFARRYGVEEGLPLEPTVIEWSLRSPQLGDPPLNDATAVALGLAAEEDLELMFEIAVEVNEALLDYLGPRGLELVDARLEFGHTNDGGIILSGDLSPDSCRLAGSGAPKGEADPRPTVRPAGAELLARIEGAGHARGG